MKTLLFTSSGVLAPAALHAAADALADLTPS
jgi:hypothetical protein